MTMDVKGASEKVILISGFQDFRSLKRRESVMEINDWQNMTYSE